MGYSESGGSAFSAAKDEREHNEKKNRGKPKKNQDKKTVRCYKYNEMGPYAYECPTKTRWQSNGRDQSRDCAFVVEKARSAKRESSESGQPSDRQLRELIAGGKDEVWITDSGASRHMTYQRDWLTEYQRTANGGTVSLGDGDECSVAEKGVTLAKKLVGGLWSDARLEEFLYVPGLKKNLFSVGVCTKKGFDLIFKNNCVNIMREGEIVASGVRQDNDTYRMFIRVVKSGVEEANAAAYNLRVCHKRLGHVEKRAIRELVDKGLVRGVSMCDTTDFVCEMCRLGKSHRLPFKD